MALTLIFLTGLMVGAVAWCVFIVRRIPSDLAELREQFAKYRASRTSEEVLSKFETLKERMGYQRECAVEFWSTLGTHVLFFWPATVLIFFLFLVPMTWWVVSSILRELRNF